MSRLDFFYFEKKPECLWQILAKSVRSGKAETKIGAKKFSFLLEGSDFYLSVEKILGGWRSLQVNIGVSCHLEKKNKKTEKGEEEKTSRLEIDKIFVTKSLDNFSTTFYFSAKITFWNFLLCWSILYLLQQYRTK